MPADFADLEQRCMAALSAQGGDAAHGLEHVQRVVMNAKQLAAAEGARLEVVVPAAWLHDCVEDQGVTVPALRDAFGDMVAEGVRLLSDLEVGNRAQRKAMSRDRLANAPGWVQTIKCADLISNTRSIVMHDSKFATVYLEEKRLLLARLTAADQRLLAIARMQASEAVG